jgi:hypothetical protein
MQSKIRKQALQFQFPYESLFMLHNMFSLHLEPPAQFSLAFINQEAGMKWVST